jgi:hypothetical protein
MRRGVCEYLALIMQLLRISLEQDHDYSPGQEIQYRFHKSSTLVPILRQMNTVHSLTSCTFRIMHYPI